MQRTNETNYFAEIYRCAQSCNDSKIYDSQNCVQIMLASTIYSTATASFTSDYFSFGSETKPFKYFKGDMNLYT